MHYLVFIAALLATPVGALEARGYHEIIPNQFVTRVQCSERMNLCSVTRTNGKHFQISMAELPLVLERVNFDSAPSSEPINCDALLCTFNNGRFAGLSPVVK